MTSTAAIERRLARSAMPLCLLAPFGGGSDFVARLIGRKLTEQMHQQVVVHKRSGAASLIGAESGINTE